MTALDEPVVEEDEDLEPLVAGRLVDLGRAVLVTISLMFLTGAAVFTWQQWAQEPRPNDVDIGFADDMRTHHLQGVAMALAYLEDGADPTFRQMANEIVLVQAGENRLLNQYLQDWEATDLDVDTAMAWMDAPVPQDAQPGMATDAELDRLDRATGEELDDLFSALMIEHHRGGVHMAEHAAAHGAEGDLTDLARAMAETQRSEVAEMNLRREALGLPPA
ncbi:MAG TPA: DUF305 domain-containing protein [Acidimicrobiales bacterium]|nr:DUF305 domain-containing protein [Acidimicrobiales bacterium]